LIRVVLFDLDDTLYDEKSFVASGFRASAACAHRLVGCPEQDFFDSCMRIIGEHGRGHVFDHALEHIGADVALASKLVEAYREHKPSISLDQQAVPMLETLRNAGKKTGLITDGMASVQRMKINVLGISQYMDLVICTDDWGRAYWKPHERAFWAALDYFKVAPHEAAYVGNDDNKDFHGANQVGLLTIKVSQQESKGTKTEPLYQAKVTVNKLSDILPLVL